MPQSGLNLPEHEVQPRFRRRRLALTVLLALAVTADATGEVPNRTPLPDRTAAIRMVPLALGPMAAPVGVQLRGAWAVTSPDPRFMGLSALAVRGGRLLALTDSGVTIDFPKPGGAAVTRLRDLPAGPGYPTFKKYRDGEALLRSADGGWFVTFEFQHSLWRFDSAFGKGARLVDLAPMDWPRNAGVEAVVGAPGGGLLLFPESGRGVLQLRDGQGRLLPLAGRTGGVADAVTLPDGRIVVAVREVGLGLVNRLAWLEPDGGGYRLRPFATLPLGWIDNVEGLAAETLPDGATRLWAVTDNDGWRRTVLVELLLPPARERHGLRLRPAPSWRAHA